MACSPPLTPSSVSIGTHIPVHISKFQAYYLAYSSNSAYPREGGLGEEDCRFQKQVVGPLGKEF
jgi:hypothetical protein